MAVVEGRGRIALQPVVTTLTWTSGTRVTVKEQGGLVVVTADDAGSWRLGWQCRVLVPVGIRRWCGLTHGSRVLLIADAHQGRVVIHPPAALDAMINRAHAEVFSGEAS
ncbi:AbrB/MazE/SpoVT family DNA-binding domain-containing protein [Actinoplanes sp. NPDC051346]|uniref:AbrB/MazE/SpoVT family DNA-binding domain-containing protein n=1 Tax=Actinoplanes sp. NPDC051346 TaxID=3155048 RepID=UPI0034171475